MKTECVAVGKKDSPKCKLQIGDIKIMHVYKFKYLTTEKYHTENQRRIRMTLRSITNEKKSPETKKAVLNFCVIPNPTTWQ